MQEVSEKGALKVGINVNKPPSPQVLCLATVIRGLTPCPRLDHRTSCSQGQRAVRYIWNHNSLLSLLLSAPHIAQARRVQEIAAGPECLLASFLAGLLSQRLGKNKALQFPIRIDLLIRHRSHHTEIFIHRCIQRVLDRLCLLKLFQHHRRSQLMIRPRRG